MRKTWRTVPLIKVTGPAHAWIARYVCAFDHPYIRAWKDGVACSAPDLGVQVYTCGFMPITRLAAALYAIPYAETLITEDHPGGR